MSIPINIPQEPGDRANITITVAERDALKALLIRGVERVALRLLMVALAAFCVLTVAHRS